MDRPGDFAQGGPLAPLTRGHGGFQAAAALPIDVAIAGNHEFDWGIPHLQISRAALPFPLLAANTKGLLPGQAVINRGSTAIAVIGLTYPGPELLPNDLLDSTRTMGEVITSEARAARRNGAEIIVAAIHQGVPFNSWKKGSSPGDELRALCQDLTKEVDLVIGGHTLTRYLGTIHGVPYLQPFSHGYEIGVCDFSSAGPALRTIRPARAGGWNGCHADLLARAREEVVGHLPVTLRSAPGRDGSLQDWIARCLHHSTGADVALFPGSSLVMLQPPVDGALGYLPAGPVTRSDLLRLYPWPDDATVVFEWADLGLPQLVAAFDGPYGGSGFTSRRPGPGRYAFPRTARRRWKRSLAAVPGPQPPAASSKQWPPCWPAASLRHSARKVR